MTSVNKSTSSLVLVMANTLTRKFNADRAPTSPKEDRKHEKGRDRAKERETYRERWTKRERERERERESDISKFVSNEMFVIYAQPF